MSNYNKVSTRASRAAQNDEELDQMEKALIQSTTPVEVEPTEPEAVTIEEEVWKKRYGDLRAHQAAKDKKEAAEKADLIKQLEKATKQELKFPENASIEEVIAWGEEFPKVAGILETFANHKIEEKTKGLSVEVENIRLERLQLAKERAVTQVLKKHEDFLELVDLPEFQEWVRNQPIERGPIIGQALQDALWENDTDAISAIKAIDQYKEDKKIKATPRRRNEPERMAATTVNVQARATPVNDGSGKRTFLESDVENMNIRDYIRLEGDIEEARREGRFVYDLSGAAR